MNQNENQVQLKKAVKEFIQCIKDLPDELFLEKIDDWSPRDILAHLIGWNRHTISGCQQIKMGNQPNYLIGAEDDFRLVNEESVLMYSFKGRDQMLDDLEDSYFALENYFLSITPEQWQQDFSVRYMDEVITIENTVKALIDDYNCHREQIQTWAENLKNN